MLFQAIPLQWRYTVARNQYLYLGGGELGEKAHVVALSGSNSTSSQEYPVFYSNQEEADTRITFHAIHAADIGAASVVICSPDTDALVLLLHQRQDMYAHFIYFSTGHEGKHTSPKRFIPVHTLYDLLKPSHLSVIIPMYCISSYDTMSIFYGHGKGTAFRLMVIYGWAAGNQQTSDESLHDLRLSDVWSTRLILEWTSA